MICFCKKIVRRLLNRQPLIDSRPRLREQIGADPDNGQLYYQLGQEYRRYRNPFTGIALFRTAQTFGYRMPDVSLALARNYLELGLFDLAQQQLLEIKDSGLPGVPDILDACFAGGKELRANTWGPECLGYGKYQRLRIIADRTKNMDPDNLKIADIGGGQGEFCLFVPRCDYALVEPSVTGVGAPDIPFADKIFDVVICPDVLEHVAKRDRESLIKDLMRLARQRVYFTAPFGEQDREMEKFFYKLTKNKWTKEHLAHEVSTLEEMGSFLKDLGVEHKIYPCSFLPLHFAMGYLNNHFLEGNKKLFAEVNEFINGRYYDFIKQEPSYGYLFELILT